MGTKKKARKNEKGGKNIYFCLVSGKQREPNKRRKNKKRGANSGEAVQGMPRPRKTFTELLPVTWRKKKLRARDGARISAFFRATFFLGGIQILGCLLLPC